MRISQVLQENRHLSKCLQQREFKTGLAMYDREIKHKMMKQSRNWDQQGATITSSRKDQKMKPQ